MHLGIKMQFHVAYGACTIQIKTLLLNFWSTYTAMNLSYFNLGRTVLKWDGPTYKT